MYKEDLMNIHEKTHMHKTVTGMKDYKFIIKTEINKKVMGMEDLI